MAELSRELGVSAVTIRSDLEALEAQGLLKRNHGGAVSTRVLRFHPDFLHKSSLHRREKEAIAARALELIEDGDRLLLDAGSTVLALARALQGRALTVVTHSLYLLNELINAPCIELIAVGGLLHPENLCFVGPLAEAFIEGLHVDTAFLGVNGVSARGLSVTSPLEAGIKRKMIQAARRVVVLADSSKFGVDSFIEVAPLEAVDQVVTDAAIPARHLNRLSRAGVEVLVSAARDVEGR